jgi:hypothetical protein
LSHTIVEIKVSVVWVVFNLCVLYSYLTLATTNSIPVVNSWICEEIGCVWSGVGNPVSLDVLCKYPRIHSMMQ